MFLLSQIWEKNPTLPARFSNLKIVSVCRKKLREKYKNSLGLVNDIGKSICGQ